MTGEETEVVCNHLFRHCLTWADKKRVGKQIDYARSIGDSAALPILLANIQWCPALGDNIPPKPDSITGESTPNP